MLRNKPLKRFGQNYLVDENILNKIVKEIYPRESDNMIEIGPGRGALTSRLLAKNKNLISVEIDFRVIEYLKNEYPSLNIINADFLEMQLMPAYLKTHKKLRIAGNIPYNLTSPIIFKLIENNNIVEDAVLMVQHEVAKRMKAGIGTKDYGIMAVLLKFFADVKFCFKISPNVFYPRPKVDSALIHIYFRELKISDKEKEFFVKTVKAGFGNRRKTLKNSLSNSIFKNVNFSDSGIDLNLRAEQLNPDDFFELAKFVLGKYRRSELPEGQDTINSTNR